MWGRSLTLWRKRTSQYLKISTVTILTALFHIMCTTHKTRRTHQHRQNRTHEGFGIAAQLLTNKVIARLPTHARAANGDSVKLSTIFRPSHAIQGTFPKTINILTVRGNEKTLYRGSVSNEKAAASPFLAALFTNFCSFWSISLRSYLWTPPWLAWLSSVLLQCNYTYRSMRLACSQR